MNTNKLNYECSNLNELEIIFVNIDNNKFLLFLMFYHPN